MPRLSSAAALLAALAALALADLAAADEGPRPRAEPPSPWRIAAVAICGVVAVAIAIVILLALSTRGASRMLGERGSEAVDCGACFLMLCAALVAYGVFQEQIMTQSWGGERFPSAACLVAFNRVVVVIAASAVLAFRRESFLPEGFMWTPIPAFTLCISSWCQHSSLHYVTFPTQVVFKSSKIVPTMAIGTAVNGSQHGWKDYLSAVVITALVIGFSLSMETADGRSAEATAAWGFGMLTVFLVCDALTSTTEKKILQRYPRFSSVQMLFVIGVFSGLYSLAIAQLGGSLWKTIDFLWVHQDAFACCLALSVCSTFSQFAIYRIIAQHGPVVLSVMMTIRQVLSVAASAWIFGHSISIPAIFFGVTLFLVLMVNTTLKLYSRAQAKKAENKPKLLEAGSGGVSYGGVPRGEAGRRGGVP